jgi:type II secretory pathway predicted ATPase ExeA
VEYLRHFEISEDPFRNDHLERFLAEIPSQTEAHRRLDRGVRQGRGLVALLGPAGSGKSVVARRLYEELEEEIFEASMMVMLRSRADSEWLLYRFARQLGVEEPADQREALAEQIYERLAIVREDGRHSVLIIDDADALATPETLAEVCALVKLEYEERRMLTVVLAGSEALDTALRADPALSHHVEARVEMRAFASDEATAYLGHRLRGAGADPDLLLPGAAAALGELAKGAPGRMNILADNALFEAFAAGRKQVARSDVERAYADLAWAPEEPAETAEAPGAYPHPRGSAKSPAPSLGGAPSSEVEGEAGDTDSQLEAIFAPVGSSDRSGRPGSDPKTMVMDFDASQTGMRPLPELAEAAPTEIQLGPADVVASEGPPKDEAEDEVDELFMELIKD